MPYVYKPNPQLGTWVHKRRVDFPKNTLSEDHIAQVGTLGSGPAKELQLNRIGFAWEISDNSVAFTEIWMTRCSELVEYKSKFRNCNVH